MSWLKMIVRRLSEVLLAAAVVLSLLVGAGTAGFSAQAAGNGQTGSDSLKSGITVTYLDVGQGDAAVIQCGGQTMMIDGGKAKASSFIYSWLKRNGISYIDYMVATHADADHIGGLSGALNYAKVGTAYCSVTSADTKTFQSFVKYLEKQGKILQVPKAGETFSLGNAKVEILGPVGFGKSNLSAAGAVKGSGQYEGPGNSGAAADSNNSSIVLKITYGKTSFLFTGDAEREEEGKLLNAGCDLSSTVLKVGHHGSDTSTSYRFLRAVDPQYAVISVGKDNSYGHPTEAVLSRLRDADVKTFRTDLQGTVTAESDGKKVVFTTEKNPDADTLADAGAGQKAAANHSNRTGDANSDHKKVPDNVSGTDGAAVYDSQSDKSSESSPTQTYVLNTNTHKFHYPGCSSVSQMKEKNKKVVTESRDEIIREGYQPCKRCKP